MLDNKIDYKLVAVGEGFSEIISALNNLGIKTLAVKENLSLPKCENNHADMRIFPLGNKAALVYKDDIELINSLKKCGIKTVCTQSPLNGKYPKSISLNAKKIGNYLVCLKEYTDNEILNYAQKNNFEIVNCKQGYAGCATCVVSDRAVITSDKSVYNALCDKIDVLLVSSGSIRLKDSFDGMIGGSAFLLNKNTLAFCGDITRHSDYISIKSFLEKHNVRPVCLTKNALTDVGGIIPLETAELS